MYILKKILLIFTRYIYQKLHYFKYFKKSKFSDYFNYLWILYIGSNHGRRHQLYVNKKDNQNTDITECNVVGPVCESGDFFAKNIELPKSEHNDLIAIYSAGAYGFTMSSTYNTRPKVAEIAIIDGEDRLIRKRDSFDDLIKNEIEFIK